MRIWAVLAAGVSLSLAALTLNFEVASGSAEPGLELVQGQAGTAPDHDVVLADIRERQQGVRAANIFGSDDRSPVLESTGPGWRTITLLLMYDERGEPLGTCSGAFISHNVVLTAAHCLYFEGDFAYSVVAAPGASEDGPEFGLADGAQFVVPEGWADGPGQDPADAPVLPSPFDWGIVVFEGDPFAGQLAPYAFMAHAEDEFFDAPTTFIGTAGFPGDKPFGSMWEAESLEYFVDDTYLYTLIDIFPGQSGSPIFAIDDNDFFIFSVISIGGPVANLSVRFTPPVLEALEGYCEDLDCSVQTWEWEPDETPTPTSTPTPVATASPSPSATPGSNRPFRGVVPQLSRD